MRCGQEGATNDQLNCFDRTCPAASGRCPFVQNKSCEIDLTHIRSDKIGRHYFVKFEQIEATIGFFFISIFDIYHFDCGCLCSNLPKVLKFVSSLPGMNAFDI